MRAYRPRSAPPPPPPPPRPPRPAQRQVWIPVSDGCFAMANGCTVRTNYTGRITIKTDGEGNREVIEEPLDQAFCRDLRIWRRVSRR